MRQQTMNRHFNNKMAKYFWQEEERLKATVEFFVLQIDVNVCVSVCVRLFHLLSLKTRCITAFYEANAIRNR